MAFLRSINQFDTGPGLVGKGVFLRTPHLSDYTQWHVLREKSRKFLTPWEPNWLKTDLTRSSFRQRIKRYAKDIRQDETYPFFIFDESREQLLGGLTLSCVRRGVTQSCSLGYWIGVSHKGKGNMTAAVRAVIPFVFNTLCLHRLEAACLPANEPSVQLLARTGFQQEGLARRYLRINGSWQDHILFALISDDPRP